MKCLPSSRNCGQKWPPSPAGLVAGEIEPPCADTRDKPPPTTGGKTITSSAFHAAPPQHDTLLAMICARPLDTRTFFRLFSEKHPTHSPSGDQNGVFAPSVP